MSIANLTVIRVPNQCFIDGVGAVAVGTVGHMTTRVSKISPTGGSFGTGL